MSQTLGIVIPVYNEVQLFESLLDRVEAVQLPDGLRKQIICVDDCSTDGTADLLKRLVQERPHIAFLFHPINQGKGGALATGFAAARDMGVDIVLIQDADHEYNPEEYPRLLAPILEGKADVVYGSRFIGETHRVLYYWHYLGNMFLTTMSNMFSNLNLTDMECCYKVFTRQVLENFTLKEKRFGVEPEMTAKFAKMRARIYEVPSSYAGRTYEEGKKINWKDGFRALYCIIKYNAFTAAPPRLNTDSPHAQTKPDAGGTATSTRHDASGSTA
jgi:glycosyltransferase involved in cell wall biosynthesis